MENAIFILILSNYNSVGIQKLQHWYSKCSLKETCRAALDWQTNLKSAL